MQPPEHDELEQLLSGLPTREPSQMLDERVAQTLSRASADAAPGTPRPVRVRYAALAAVLVIAAALIAVLAINDGGPPAAEPGPTGPGGLIAQDPDEAGPQVVNANYSEPVNLLWTREVGGQTRYTPAGRPYRAVIREAVDHKSWIDPDTGATLQLYTPREELIVVKQMTF